MKQLVLILREAKLLVKKLRKKRRRKRRVALLKEMTFFIQPLTQLVLRMLRLLTSSSFIQ